MTSGGWQLVNTAFPARAWLSGLRPPTHMVDRLRVWIASWTFYFCFFC